MIYKFGDRVTYIDSKNNQTTRIIDSDYTLQNFNALFSIEQILKIERQKYEVIEKKEELLMQKEPGS